MHVLKRHWVFISLCIIFAVALFFRVYKLGTVPHNLSDDEIANTYGAQYILKNGVDLYGNTTPLLYFDKFGDYPPVLPMYVSGLSSLVFGTGEFGSRFLIALLGALTVIPVFLLAKLVFKNTWTALFAAGILAILPWHVTYSRVNSEGIVGLFVFTWGIWLLLVAVTVRSLRIYVPAFIVLLLTYLLYPSFRIIVPLTLIAVPVLIWQYGWKTRFMAVVAGSVIIAFALTFYISSTVWGKGRFDQTSIFTTVSGVEIQLKQFIFNEPDITTARIFNNKPVYFGREFLRQYSFYFSPTYLFFDGGQPKHYRYPNSGLAYVSLAVLTIIALIAYFRRSSTKMAYPLFLVLLYILALSPIPAALTVVDSPHTHRSITMSVFLVFVFAFAFHSIISSKLWKIPVLAVLGIVLSAEVIFFYHHYLQHTNAYAGLYRNEGSRELVEFIVANKDIYDEFYISSSSLWFALYYLYYTENYDPSLAGKFGKDFRIDKIDNVYFMPQNCPSEEIINMSMRENKLAVSRKAFIADSSDCQPRSWGDKQVFDKIGTISRTGITDVFTLLRIVPTYTE